MKTSSEPLCDVVAQNIKTGAKRLIGQNKSEKAAEAIICFAVARLGVDEEFFYEVPAGSVKP